MLAKNLKHLRNKLKTSQTKVAEAVGITRQAFSTYETGKSEPTASVLKKLADYYKVTVDELLAIDLSANKKSVAKSKKQVVLVTVDDANKNKIGLVPISAQAGYALGCTDKNYIKQLPVFSLPKHIHGNFRAFEINGDSMPPINSGSIVIGEYIESWNVIKNSNRYIIVHRDGIVFKRVHKEQDCLILVSDNPMYAPYTIKKEDILEIWHFYSHIEFSSER